jgi:DNA-binding MarR family transcriptional regulator
MTWVPAHSEAANDAALRGAPLALYDWLLYQLEPHSYRPVKISAVARILRMKRQTVGVALKILCANGYLESSPTSETRILAYRICLTRKKQLPAA